MYILEVNNEMVTRCGTTSRHEYQDEVMQCTDDTGLSDFVLGCLGSVLGCSSMTTFDVYADF